MFVGQRIDDSDFLFGCQIIRFGKSHGGEVFAPQASEHDVIENVVFQLGKRRRGDLLVADDLPDGFDGFSCASSVLRIFFSSRRAISSPVDSCLW